VGADTLSFVLAIEEMANVCASTALISVAHATACKAILIGGDDVQKRRFLPLLAKGERLGAFAVHEANSGVIAPAIETTAKANGDGYIVNGSKIFITNAQEAEVYLVLVVTDKSKGPKGISLLIIEKDTSGFSFGRKEEKMGLNGTSSRELFFQDCRVPKENLLGEEGKGLQLVSAVVSQLAMFGMAAIALGIAQSAIKASIKHGRERIIATQPIGVNQGIQYLIAEMSTSVDVARAFLYRTVTMRDSDSSSSPIDAFKAKLFATQMAVEVTDKALQVHGGHGYCKEFLIERYYRDARGLTLHFVTPELLKANIGKMLMGL
jgi:alkylation response protein AidB-like acyl-CoA dehydrogenase